MWRGPLPSNLWFLFKIPPSFLYVSPIHTHYSLRCFEVNTQSCIQLSVPSSSTLMQLGGESDSMEDIGSSSHRSSRTSGAVSDIHCDLNCQAIQTTKQTCVRLAVVEHIIQE